MTLRTSQPCKGLLRIDVHRPGASATLRSRSERAVATAASLIHYEVVANGKDGKSHMTISVSHELLYAPCNRRSERRRLLFTSRAGLDMQSLAS